MTYQEVMEENPTISHSLALAEIKDHSASVSEFYQDCGKLENYKAASVLGWLGY